MFWLLRKFIGVSCVLSLMVVGLGGYVYFQAIDRSEELSPTPAGIDVAIDQVCQQLVDALPNPQIALRPTLILTLESDRQALITASMSRWLSEDGRYRPVDPGLLDQLYQTLGFEERVVLNREDAVRFAQSADAEVVIYGRINQFEIDERAVNLNLDIHVFDLLSNEQVYDGRLANSEPDLAIARKIQASQSDFVLPCLALICLALAWPIACFPGIRAVLKLESNLFTAVVLIVVIAMPVFAWSSAVSSLLSGILAWLLLLLGAIVISVWCLYVTNALAGSD